MVEQEHSKTGSSVFPESLISTSISQTFPANEWFFNDTKPLIKSDELHQSDLLSNELLYGISLPNNEIFCFPISAEKDNTLFQEKLPNDISSVTDMLPSDLYYNDQNMSHIKDWNPISGNNTGMSDPDYFGESPLSYWVNSPYDLETLKMDNIFQVDKDDLVLSPTLAELNAVDESILDTSAFDNFDTSLLTDDKLTKSSLSAPVSNAESTYRMPSESETTQIKATSIVASTKPNLLLFPTNASGSEESLSANQIKCNLSSETNRIDSLSSPPMSKSTGTTDAGSEIITKPVTKSHTANEPNINADIKRIEKNSELSSLNHVTPDSDDDDSEMDCDYSSDVDEESEEEAKVQSSKQAAANHLVLQKKKSRYFWQYNIQSKGPKAPKVKLAGKAIGDDHFSAVSDPIFTSSNLNKGIKHAGKARRGDGNDLTPNAYKLYSIGLELEKLTSVIEGLVPANELPLNARSKSRKEKNKLASRACRLKKKAQHEANKLKLFGLAKEQKHLTELVNEVKKIMKKSVENVKLGKVQSNVRAKVESLTVNAGFTEVAGCSAEFVNNVLKDVEKGDKTGGLVMEDKDEGLVMEDKDEGLVMEDKDE